MSPEIALPPASLVALVGPAGAGKSTFAAAHFKPSEILSSDECRLLVSDDAGDQSASAPAFAVLYFIAARRARRGRLTVVDATNVRPADRQRVLWLAHRYRRPAIAIVFDLPLELCLERNLARVERQVGAGVVREQWERMPRSADAVVAEGFSAVHWFHSATEAGSVLVRTGAD
ncbi:MAG TPA: AAA family ATPase [Candidatus Dormibacteraeota bacterium]